MTRGAAPPPGRARSDETGPRSYWSSRSYRSSAGLLSTVWPYLYQVQVLPVLPVLLCSHRIIKTPMLAPPGQRDVQVASYLPLLILWWKSTDRLVGGTILVFLYFPFFRYSRCTGKTMASIGIFSRINVPFSWHSIVVAPYFGTLSRFPL